MATIMNVSLPDDLATFVEEELRDGGYGNRSELLREGLRLLRERREKRRALQAALEVGHADRRTRPLTAEVLRQIADRARTRRIEGPP
jgi:antitoxin ParD1/3/4